MTKARSNATAPNAKGTLVVGNGTDASTTLAVASTAGYVLTVDSAEATGLKWAAASSSSGPAFRVTRSAGYNIPSQSTDTTIPWNTETFDTDNCFNTSTYRFTPNKAGYYLFSCYLYVNNDNGSTAQLGTGWVLKNGTDKFSLFRNSVGTAGWDNPGYTGAGAIIYANGTTDYFELQVNFEGSVNRAISSLGSYWNGVFVRGA